MGFDRLMVTCEQKQFPRKSQNLTHLEGQPRVPRGLVTATMGATRSVRNEACTLIKTHILCFGWDSYGGRLSRERGFISSVGITTRQYFLSTCMTVPRNHRLYTSMRCMLCSCCWWVIVLPTALLGTPVSNILNPEITWGIIPMPPHNGACIRLSTESLIIFDTKASGIVMVLIQESVSCNLEFVSPMPYPENFYGIHLSNKCEDFGFLLPEEVLRPIRH